MRDAARDRVKLYEQIGAMEGCRQLAAAFHDRVAHHPLLAPMFPRNLAAQTERLALFMAEALGGPAEYTARRGKQSLKCRHAHLPIGCPEGEAWVEQMSAAIDAVGIAEPARGRLRRYFVETAETLEDPLIELYTLPLDALRDVLERRPDLAAGRDVGRTLLMEAAGRWDAPRVEVLLQCGADVRSRDGLGHDALYYAANALAPGREAEGCAVVGLLIERGADVDGRSGPVQTAPLHMAARRGSAAVGEALLAAGADIELPDAKGETPLRRAVNCGQETMVRLLLSRGADPLTRDRRGRTALDAARHAGIREALERAAGPAR